MVRTTAEKQFVELMLLFGVEMPRQPGTELCASCIQGLFSSAQARAKLQLPIAPLPSSCTWRNLSACPTSLVGHSCGRAAPASSHLHLCSGDAAGSQAALGAAAHTQKLVLGQQVVWAPFPALWARG